MSISRVRLSSPRRALWLFLLVFWVCHVVRNGLLEFPKDFDTLMYHLPLIDHWFQGAVCMLPMPGSGVRPGTTNCSAYGALRRSREISRRA